MATSTSTTRSVREATQSNLAGALAAVHNAPDPNMSNTAMRLMRGARRGISTMLFGSDAVRMLDMRDVNAYYRTTEG